MVFYEEDMQKVVRTIVEISDDMCNWLILLSDIRIGSSQNEVVLCHSVAKVLTLENPKNILHFPRLIVSLPLRGEGTHARKCKKIFCIFLA